VEARRGEPVVGALTGVHAHRVEVHPLIAIAPLPSTAYASSHALERRQEACTHFGFHLSAGQLPHAERPSYPVRAVVVPVDPATVDRELRDATFRLDAKQLDIEGVAATQPGGWYKGRSLTPAELIGDHELCVRIGKPSAADPARPVELRMAATLLEDPYDEFRVIEPFTLKVLVSPPTFLEKWRGAVIGGMTLSSILALLWYFRDRPILARDLGYSIGRDDATAALSPSRSREYSSLARFLGWIAEQPVIAPGEDRPLARIRPVDDALFQLRLASGVRIDAPGREEVIAFESGRATLAVHRTYRLRGDNGSYLFRMEYR
jgi:hypothetical protein